MTTEPILPPLRDGVLYIDNSSLEQFSTCSRQAYYYKIRKRELDKTRIALDFGDRFHKVLEYLYLNYGTQYRNADANQKIIAFASSLKIDTPQDDYRTIPYLVDAVSQYVTQYPAEPWALVPLDGDVPAVEIPFTYPLGELTSTVFGTIPIVWTGKIDLPYRSQGRLGFMDHKTTSMMGPQYFAEFEISHQMYGYANALEHIFGEPCVEFTINALGCRKPSRTGTKFEFSRHIVQATQPLKDEWKRDTLALVSDFIAHCEQGYFPKMTKWCVGKYGPCQYKSICTMNPDVREHALASGEYRDVTWDPLKKEGA